MNDSETVILITVITVSIPSILGIIIWYIKTKFTMAVETRKIAEERLKTEADEKRKKDVDVQIKRYESKIKDFYYPIYIRLVAGENAYKKVIGPRRTNTISSDIRRLLLKQEIMPAHEKIIEIYTNNAYMIEGDNILLYEFIKFAQHLAVLKSIHKTKNDHISARELGSPYPTTLLPVLHDRFMRDSQCYNKLVGHNIYKNEVINKSSLNLLDRLTSPQKQGYSNKSNSIKSDEDYTNSTTDSISKMYVKESPPRKFMTPKYYRNTCSPAESKTDRINYLTQDLSQSQSTIDINKLSEQIEESQPQQDDNNSIEKSIYTTINTEIDPESLSKMKESMDKWSIIKRRGLRRPSPSIEYDSNCDIKSNLSL